MSYRIIIDKQAAKFIRKLPTADKERVLQAINKLPSDGDIKKLQGYHELYRLRVGSYRIIYTVDNGELIVVVIDAGNRGQIYYRY